MSILFERYALKSVFLYWKSTKMSIVKQIVCVFRKLQAQFCMYAYNADRMNDRTQLL